MTTLILFHDVLGTHNLWIREFLDTSGIDAILASVRNPSPYQVPCPLVRLRKRVPGLRSHLFYLPKTKRFGYLRLETYGKLRRLTKSPDIKNILVGDLHTAQVWRKVWAKIDKPVWVYVGSQSMVAASDRQIVLPENVRFLAADELSKEHLIKRGVHEERIVVSPLEKTTHLLTPPRPTKSTSINILFFDQLTEETNPEFTIRAFNRACDLGFDGYLTIAGDGPLFSQCCHLLSQSKYRHRVELWREQILATGLGLLWGSADVFTTHGFAENQNELARAMGQGLPIVASKGSVPSDLVRDGQEGILIDRGDVEQCAKAFLELANQPALRFELGRRGYERLKEMGATSQDMKMRQLEELLQ